MGRKRVVVIPARFGSERFRGKLAAPLKGKPVLYYPISTALGSSADEVVVATDSKELGAIAEKSGAKVFYVDSASITTGTERVALCVERYLPEAELVVNLQGDEVGVPSEVVDSVFEELEKGERFVTVVKRGSFPELLHPDRVKVAVSVNGYALYFSRSVIPYPRKPCSHFYLHVGIYGFSRESLLDFYKWERGVLEAAESLEQLRILEAGERIKAVVAEGEFHAVDSPADIHYLESLWGEGE